MAEKREIKNATRSFLKHLSRMSDEGAMAPQIAAAFLGELGEGDQSKGLRELGKALKQDFDHIRGENLTEAERALFERKDGNIIKIHTLVMDFIRRIDEGRDVDVSGLTDSEINQALVDVAVQAAIQNENIRAMILNQLFDALPDLRQQIMEMGGNAVLPVSMEEEIDYDEADSYEDE